MSVGVLWFTSTWEMTSHSSWVQSLNILPPQVHPNIFNFWCQSLQSSPGADQVFLKATCLSLIFSITHFSRGILIYWTPLWPSMIINIMHFGPFHIGLLAKVQNWEPQQSLCCPIECGAWVLKCRGVANSHVQHKNKKKIYIWMFRKKKGMRFIFQLDTANFGPQYKSRNYFNLKKRLENY